MEENKEKTAVTGEESKEQNTENSSKTYTQEDVEKLVQAEADRRVNQARSKWEKETKRKMTEAEKLAKMSDEERYQYELNKKEEEMTAKERELNLRQNKIEALKVMDSKGIPAALVDYIVAEDAEEMMNRITVFDKHIKAAVAAEVKARLASPTPRAGIATETDINKETFAKMGYTERVELKNANPELYNKLVR